MLLLFFFFFCCCRFFYSFFSHFLDVIVICFSFYFMIPSSRDTTLTYYVVNDHSINGFIIAKNPVHVKRKRVRKLEIKKNPLGNWSWNSLLPLVFYFSFILFIFHISIHRISRMHNNVMEFNQQSSEA